MNTKKNISIATSQHPDYEHEIITIIRSTMTPKLIKEKIGEYHENDIAAALDLLKKDDRHKLYSILDTQTLANVLEYSEQRNNYIDEMGIRKRVDFGRFVLCIYWSLPDFAQGTAYVYGIFNFSLYRSRTSGVYGIFKCCWYGHPNFIEKNENRSGCSFRSTNYNYK